MRVAFDIEDSDEVLEDLAARISPRVLEAPRRLDPVRRQIEEYFEGLRTAFEVPVDLQLAHGFRRKALGYVAGIPYGRTASYKEVATGAELIIAQPPRGVSGGGGAWGGAARRRRAALA